MRALASTLLSLAASLPVLAAGYTNTATSVIWRDPIPPFNFATWWNSAPQFEVISTDPYLPFTPTALVNFTNTGNMFGTPGWRFVNYTTTDGVSRQSPMGSFLNNGNIFASSRLTVMANDLANHGKMVCNETGFILLNGRSGKLNLYNGGLQAGAIESATTDAFLYARHLGRNNNGGYTNDLGVTDMWWGMGYNDRLGSNTPPSFTDALAFELTLPTSPLFQSTALSFTGPYNTYNMVPQYAPPSYYMAYYSTNFLNPSNRMVQVVWVATNLVNPNLSANVRFVAPSPLAGFTAGYTSVVQFAWADTNIVDNRRITNALYLLDSLPASGNAGIFNNMDRGPMRPGNFEVTRGIPVEWLVGFPPTYATNQLSTDFFHPFAVPDPFGGTTSSITNRGDVLYSGYSAWLGVTNYAPNPVPIVMDPTNLPGKVEIYSGSLNATNLRIRAENFVSVQTDNLSGNRMPRIDAPLVNLDVASTSGSLVMSNTLPDQSIRFFGQLAAYSVAFSNGTFRLSPNPTNATLQVTNHAMTYYHVLIVDNGLQPAPVSLPRLSLQATNLFIDDAVRVTDSILLGAQNLTVGPNGSLQFPANDGWNYTNVPNLKALTNYGLISIPLDATFSGKTTPYDAFVNHGFIAGGAFDVWSKYFENTGTNSFSHAVMGCTNGNFNVRATTVKLVNDFLTNRGPISITAYDIDARISTITSGIIDDGTGVAWSSELSFTPTNLLSDGSSFVTSNATWRISSNDWWTTGGILVNRRPTNGTLMGTVIHSTLVPSGRNIHRWPGRDVGASAGGYNNNLAVGKLVLDSTGLNPFVFQGLDFIPTNHYALYVDYLQLNGDSTNFAQVFDIAPNFTLYFADSSYPPDKLDGAVGGRMVWVPSFAGPFSGTNFVYVITNSYGDVSTNYYLFNRSVVGNPDFDSDYDGIVNPDDPTPLFTPSQVDLVVTGVWLGTPPQLHAKLTWTALAYALNVVEYSTSLNSGSWSQLTNFVQGPVTQRVSFTDPTAGTNRVYRVREDPRWPPHPL